MIHATRCHRVLARSVAVAIAFALLPTAADAVLLYNRSGATMKFFLYDQNDSAVAVSCFDTQLPANSQVTFPGFPGTCGLYAVLKVKAVGVRSLFSDGATCWGEHLDKNGEAQVTGGLDNCGVTIVN